MGCLKSSDIIIVNLGETGPPSWVIACRDHLHTGDKQTGIVHQHIVEGEPLSSLHIDIGWFGVFFHRVGLALVDDSMTIRQ
jgi:hypothetical protein